MIDYMLKFEDKDQAEAVLKDNGLMVELEGRLWPSAGHNVDVIGSIFKPDGTFNTTEEGYQIPNMVELDGYHVNVRTNGAIEALEQYAVTPATPYRVWA